MTKPIQIPPFYGQLNTSGNSFVIHIPKRYVRTYKLSKGTKYLFELTFCKDSTDNEKQEKVTTFKK